MSTNFYGATGLTGGTDGKLDDIDGATLADGDGALVITASTAYSYILDDDSAAAEDSPNVIEPDANGGDKRWLLVAMNNQGVRTTDSTAFAGLDLTGITDGNIPYMSASGFADSHLSINDNKVGFGTDDPDGDVHIYNSDTIHSILIIGDAAQSTARVTSRVRTRPDSVA